jgi:hypothetical protein
MLGSPWRGLNLALDCFQIGFVIAGLSSLRRQSKTPPPRRCRASHSPDEPGKRLRPALTEQ